MQTTKQTYGQRMASLVQRTGGLCVGMDPSVGTLQAWGLSQDADGAEKFAMTLLDACLEEGIALVKPQSAFFEQFGWQGVRALGKVITRCREQGVLVILDVKRGDIGSTCAAYARASLSSVELDKGDAVTLNPYLGFADLEPFLKLTQSEPVGLFVVVRSSNPASALLQQAVTSRGTSVACSLAADIEAFNRTHTPQGMGPVGAVIGATMDDCQPILECMPSAFLLCPGVGAQGATAVQAVQRLGAFAKQAIFPLSRGIAGKGPEMGPLRDSMRRWRGELSDALAAV